MHGRLLGKILSYMCLIAHFIDENCNLHIRIINYCPIGGHSEELVGRARLKNVRMNGGLRG